MVEVTYTLAYFGTALNTSVQVFLAGVNVIKLVSFIADDDAK